MAGGIAIAIAALRDRLGLGSSEEDAAETEQARLETETQQSAAVPQEEEKPSTSGKEKERVFVSGPEGFTFYDVFFWRWELCLGACALPSLTSAEVGIASIVTVYDCYAETHLTGTERRGWQRALA